MTFPAFCSDKPPPSEVSRDTNRRKKNRDTYFIKLLLFLPVFVVLLPGSIFKTTEFFRNKELFIVGKQFFSLKKVMTISYFECMILIIMVGFICNLVKGYCKRKGAEAVAATICSQVMPSWITLTILML